MGFGAVGITKEDIRDALLTDDTKFAGGNIDMKVSEAGVKLEPVAHGTLTADGTEQELAELTSEDPAKFYGWIDLDNMQVGDRVTLRTYAKDEEGNYKVHAVENYEDAQTEPMVNVVLKVDTAYRLMLEQTAGAYRTYGYHFFREG